MATMRVLMVCLGNICRSPMAQGALEAAARAEGLAVTVDSACVEGWHAGAAPDARAMAAAARCGVDITAQRARPVRPEDFAAFDLILAMDARVQAALRAMRPRGPGASLGLLLDYAPGDAAGRDVPDPYYMDAEAFHRTMALIETGVAGLVPHLRAMAQAASGESAPA